MKFGINYSTAAIGLYDQGIVTPDVFKCPAWPDLIENAKAHYPIYIHFPLNIGAGIGDAIDGETKAPADWRKFERLLDISGTPYLNLHLLSPDELGFEDDDPYNAERALENLITDAEAVIRRFGADKVIVENGFNLGPNALFPAFFAETVTQVVENTGCGFLFDLSHARMAATRLGVDYRSYITRLPLQHTREVHITGIQKVDAYWMQRALDSGMTREALERYTGPEGVYLPNGMSDHLPLSEEDWPIMSWAASQLRAGRWGDPWVIALECGGIGPFWEATYTQEEMQAQVPRLQAIFSE